MRDTLSVDDETDRNSAYEAIAQVPLLSRCFASNRKSQKFNDRATSKRVCHQVGPGFRCIRKLSVVIDPEESNYRVAYLGQLNGANTKRPYLSNETSSSRNGGVWLKKNLLRFAILLLAERMGIVTIESWLPDNMLAVDPSLRMFRNPPSQNGPARWLRSVSLVASRRIHKGFRDFPSVP